MLDLLRYLELVRYYRDRGMSLEAAQILANLKYATEVLNERLGP